MTTALATTTAAMPYIQSQGLESFQAFGADPMLVLGVSVLGSGAAGWLMGPFLGEGVFGVRYRALRGQMDEVS